MVLIEDDGGDLGAAKVDACTQGRRGAHGVSLIGHGVGES
jgi:hypothetical protein